MSWVITGGSGGIGGQLAVDLIESGDKVHVWDLKPPEFEGAVFHEVDLSAEKGIEEAAGQIEEPLTALVHAAGASRTAGIHDPAFIDVLRFTYEVHVVAFLRAFRALERKLHSGGGSVVAITSAAQDVTYAGSLVYGASKIALDRVVRQLAVEYGSLGIRVNAIAPGAIATPMTETIWSDPEFAAERKSYIPLGFQAQPRSVADAVRFLASTKADYITGHTLWVDGGVRLGMFTQAAQALVSAQRE